MAAVCLGLNVLILAWLNNYTHYKVLDEITYPFIRLEHWSLGMDK